MPDVFTQWTMRTADLIPANYVTNTFSFGVLEANLPALHTALFNQYDLIHSFFPATVSQTGHELSSYDRADPKPRSPLLTTTHNFASACTGNSLPSEVAICLSFQAEKLSGDPQSRRRGRVYFGPISATYSDAQGRPSSGLRTGINNFGKNLLAGGTGAGTTYLWEVWSTVNEAPVAVANGWTDDAFDIQRRRGVKPLGRLVFPP